MDLDYLPPLNMTKIRDSIWLGAFYPSLKREELQDLGITHILSVMKQAEEGFPEAFKYLVVPVDDLPGEDLQPYFESCCKFI